MLASGSSAFRAWRRRSSCSTRGRTCSSGTRPRLSRRLSRRARNVLDRWVRGGRGTGIETRLGGAWPDPDSASRYHGVTWEISYMPYTCVTRRLRVRLHDMEIVTRQASPCVAEFRAGRHADDGLSRRYGADARGWRTIAHLRGREKALKPCGWLNRRVERIMDARPKLLRRGMQTGRARLGHREDRARHRGSVRVLRHRCPEPVPGAGA